jgi:thiol-disulfide isomerase/thioredoxin
MKLTCKKIAFLFILLYSFTQLFAQAPKVDVKDLKIGDQCPDFIFGNLINYPKNMARLSDFKGRLVILDFWATWCGPCLTALPKLDSLQKDFGSKIMVIPVTYEETGKVKIFLKNSSNLNKLILPVVTKDVILAQYFRHNLIPHEVCIDGNGKVIAITEAEAITTKNIKSLLAGKDSVVAVKKDILNHDFNNSPLLIGGLGKNYSFDKTLLKYSSILTGYIDGIPSIDGAPNVYNNVAKILSTNTAITGLYQTALGTRDKSLRPSGFIIDPYMQLRLPARTLWEAKDTALRNRLFRWRGRVAKSWKAIPLEQKLFTYELILPKEDSLKLNAYAIEDLNRYFGNLFGIIGVKENRKVKCWALEVIDEKLLPVSKGGKPDYTCNDNLKQIKLKNYKISDFLFWWLIYEMQEFPEPIIDNTQFSQSIDLEISADPKNLNSVNEALKKYGLEFKESERDVDMIVITDKK